MLLCSLQSLGQWDTLQLLGITHHQLDLAVQGRFDARFGVQSAQILLPESTHITSDAVEIVLHSNNRFISKFATDIQRYHLAAGVFLEHEYAEHHHQTESPPPARLYGEPHRGNWCRCAGRELLRTEGTSYPASTYSATSSDALSVSSSVALSNQPTCRARLSLSRVASFMYDPFYLTAHPHRPEQPLTKSRTTPVPNPNPTTPSLSSSALHPRRDLRRC